MSSIRVLKTFLAVADEGSFAAAAQRVALTQAAVGQQMRGLEAELSRTLFERQGKTVVLADAGRALVPQVRKLVAQYEQMAASSPAGEPMRGTVHLGAIVSAVRPLVQSTLALKARHPGLELHVAAAKSMELVARVEAGELDATIVVADGSPARSPLAWTPLYAEPIVLLAPRKWDEATPRAMLQAHPFIRFDRTQRTGQLVERALKRLRVRPHELLELNAIEGIVELVRAGLGVALLPQLRDARWAADPRLRVMDVPGAPARQVALVQRRPSRAAAIIAALAREFPH